MLYVLVLVALCGSILISANDDDNNDDTDVCIHVLYLFLLVPGRQSVSMSGLETKFCIHYRPIKCYDK